MSGHREHIVWATHCDARNVAAIEGIMRERHGGDLDELTLDEFVALAREAHRAVTWMREREQRAEFREVLDHFALAA